MKKTYCDKCGVEVPHEHRVSSGNSLDLEIPFIFAKRGHSAKAAVIIHCMKAREHWETTPEEPDFCKYCVIDAINKLDDRPKEKP